MAEASLEFGAVVPGCFREPVPEGVAQVMRPERPELALASVTSASCRWPISPTMVLLRRTVYAARYLVDETYRRRIGRQLNKGENVHALKRMLAYAGERAIRRPHHEQQAEQMWCLTLATNAVVTTEYNGLAVTALRRSGRDIDDAVLAHIWPTHHENIHFYVTHSVDVAGELAKLGSDGYRPLRNAVAQNE